MGPPRKALGRCAAPVSERQFNPSPGLGCNLPAGCAFGQAAVAVQVIGFMAITTARPGLSSGFSLGPQPLQIPEE